MRAVLYFGKGDINTEDEHIQPFVFASQHHRGNAAFVYVNQEGQVGGEFSEYFGIETLNALMAITPVGEEDVDKYMFTGAWNNEDVKVWVQSFLDDKLEKHFRSEEPYPETRNPVKQLVGTNFEETVHKPNTHVLVEFYAPWCHHCKKLAPKYLKLAEELAYFGEELIIAKIDGTANEVKGLVVDGFPTIYYYGKDSTNAVHYNGALTKESIRKFLKKKMGDDWRTK